MRRHQTILRNICCALAAGALTLGMVPAGAVSAYAQDTEGQQAGAVADDASAVAGSDTDGTATDGSGSADGAASGTTDGSDSGTTDGSDGGSSDGSGDGTDSGTDPTPDPDPKPAPDVDKLSSKVKPCISVSYAYSHDSNKSQKWQTVTVNGSDEMGPGAKAWVTTTSTTKRLECVRMKIRPIDELDDAIKDSYTIGIKYKVLSGSKWGAWESDGTSAGTDGTKIQAIRIKLTGTVAKYYSVHYRVKTRGTSWLGWASDGAKAGTSGILRDLSDLQVVIKKKGKAAPGSAEAAFITSSSAAATYTLYNASGKAKKAKKLGNTAGKAAKTASNGIGIAVKNNSKTVSGYFTYRVYQKTKGISKQTKSGKRAGVKSKSYPVTAISINRKGKLRSYYDVYYRVYVKNYGWMGWAKNGQLAGSKVFDDFNVSAFQVKLVYKGGVSCGSTANHYSDSNGVLKKSSEKLALQKAKATLDKKANKTSSATGYLLLCDRSTCYTAVYTGSKGHWKRVRFWQCCVGASSSPTPTGSYTVEDKEYVFHGEENAYSCYYGVVFDAERELMFHSVGYKNNGSQKDSDIIFSNLGTWASHGCVRLELKNAKWLYDTLPIGTKVVIF